MLETGARVEFKDEETAAPERGTVASCNKRGTSCVIEFRPGERKTINLNKVEYTVLDDKSDEDEATSSASGEAVREEDSQDREEPGTLGREDADEEMSNGGRFGGSEGDVAIDVFDTETAVSVDAFCDAAYRPEDFAKASDESAGLARLAQKALFDYTQATAMAHETDAPGLKELHVDGFDAEQIWAQLDLACGAVLKRLRKRISKLPPELRLVDEETEAMLDELMQQLDSGGLLEEEEAAEDNADSPAESDVPEEAGTDSDQSAEEVEAEDDPDRAADRLLRKKVPKGVEKSSRARESDPKEKVELLPTEDDHFRLGDMEAFVQRAEEEAAQAWAKEAEGGSNEEDSDDEEEDEDGLFGIEAAAEESNSDEEDAELARLLESATALAGRAGGSGKAKQSSRGYGENGDGIMYEDFFGPAGQEEDQDDADEADETGLLRNRDELDGDEDQSESGSEKEAYGEDLEAEEGNLGADEAAEVDGEPQEGLSAHERRMQRMAERARRLEEENMGEKQWYMRGEAGAASRPLNSALEVDLDFERAVQPPPEPTEVTTSTLEDLIKRRIVDAAFDDPQRLAPPPDNLQKELAELDDKKASKGLGEVYEDEFVRAKAGNTTEDKDEKTRSEARLVLRELFSKLDALSHFHFAPKPIIKEPTIQREVPALALEEVAPQVVSEAARQLPEEVYKPSKGTDTTLLTPAEKRTRRAAKKRNFKKRKLQEEDAGHQKGLQATGNIVGRKSDAAETEAAAAAKKLRKKRKRSNSVAAGDGPKLNYTKSSAVFGKIQDERDGKAPRLAPEAFRKSSSFKL